MAYTRRNYPRVNFDEPVTLIVKINDQQIVEPVLNNMSMGGICISIKGTIEPNQKGVIEIMQECDNELLNVKAEIITRWCKPSRKETDKNTFGAQFTYYSPLDLQKLARIILGQVRKQQEDEFQSSLA